MNILVTGGTGLIGRALIKELLNQNTSITVLTRSKVKAKKLFDPKVNLIENLSLDNIESCDVIINLAGEPIANKRWSSPQKTKICQSRWQITEQLTQLIKQANLPPSLFISGSAIGIYGSGSNQPIDENFIDFHPEFTHTVCSQWEQKALDACSDKTRVVLLRTGIVLDNNGGAMAKMLLPFKLGVGGKIGDGKQFMSWIHIDDMVSAILHIKEKQDIEGAVNLTAPNAVSNDEFSHSLAKQLNRLCLFTTPKWFLNLLLGEMSGLLVNGQNVVPTKLISSGFVFKHPKLEQALKALFPE
ncbi:MAG: TIGR01777 family oxidoreductase [Colwellia sp.]